MNAFTELTATGIPVIAAAIVLTAVLAFIALRLGRKPAIRSHVLREMEPSQGCFCWSYNTEHSYFDPKIWDILGRSEQELPPRMILERYVHPLDRHKLSVYFHRLHKGDLDQPLDLVFRIQHRNFQISWVQLSAQLSDDAQTGLEISGCIRHLDFSGTMSLDTLSKGKAVDAITDLPGDEFLTTEIERMMHQKSFRTGAIFIIDIKRFKSVNQVHSYDCGDIILRLTGQRCRQVLGSDDCIARLGSDEFCIISPITKKAAARSFAKQLLREIQKPIYVNNRALQLDAVIGYSLYPAQGDNFYELMSKADLAVTMAKKLHQNCFLYQADDKTLLSTSVA